MPSEIGTLAISDSGFVFDPSTGNTYSVNATGLAVLHGLKNGRTLQQIKDDLARDFQHAGGVDEHLRQFMKLLFDFGLLPESEFPG